ncbi:MAG: hydroxyacylglutathione hydrolase [Pseudomonadota bacterium]
MASLEIALVPLLRDNYGYLLHEPASALTGVVDPSESQPVLEAAAARGWRLTHVLNTHHHADHCGGNRGIKAATGARVVGPAYDRARIPEIDEAVDEASGFRFGRLAARVLFIPGHTRGHIAFWFESAHALFCGDTLFSLGCGRLFEGDPPTMWGSLSKLKALPGETRIYCGHEYTEANARFALTVDPDNEALKARAAEVKALRAQGRPTIPSTMESERAANPFLRADDPAIARRLGLEGAPAHEVFGEIRRRKDSF